MRIDFRSGIYVHTICAWIVLFSIWIMSPVWAQKKSRIKTIYIVPSSHYDLGFKVPPEDILDQLKPHVDEIIENAKSNPDFRFTIECTWHVLEWLKRTKDPELKKDFSRLVNKGQIEVSAMFGSMHTEFMGVEGLNRIAYDWAKISRELGIKTDLAMMNDVPGYLGRMPQIIAESGLKYFLNGSNLFIGGGTELYPGTMPIYWQSRDGSKVFMWQTQGKEGGYTEAISTFYLDPRSNDPYSGVHFYPDEYKGLSNLEIMEKGINKMISRHVDEGYQYDALLAQHSHDFVTSDWVVQNLLPSVEEWNREKKSPKLKVATASEFFNYMEEKYGSEIPTYQGTWTGLWSEVKLNSPGISATARWLHNQHLTAEMIWSALSIRDGKNKSDLADDPVHGEWFKSIQLYPEGNLDEVRYKLFKYEEHSGSGQTGWPKLMTKDMINRQNSQYVEYVQSSKKDLEVLLDAGLKALGTEQFEALSSRGFRMMVFNPLSWNRTDVISIPGGTEKVVEIIDLSSEKNVKFSSNLNGQVEFIANKVPPIGYKLFWVETSPGENEALTLKPDTDALKNSNYEIKVGSSDGLIESIVDAANRKELVGKKASHGFNQLLRWTFEGDDPIPFGNARFSGASSDIADYLIISRPGTMWPKTVITSYRDIKRFDISNTIDRSHLPFVPQTGDADYYSFMFPTNFTNSPKVWLENGQGFYRYPDDYLPGARMNGAAPQHTLVLEQDEGEQFTLMFNQRETFYHHFDGNLGESPLIENTIKAAVMRKQDQGVAKDWGSTYFPSLEPGLDYNDVYNFSFSSTSEQLNKIEGLKKGYEFNMPMLASPLPGSAIPAQKQCSLFSYEADNVFLLAFKRAENGSYDEVIVRFQEISGQSANFKLNSYFQIEKAEKVSLNETDIKQVLDPNALSISMGPYELLTLKLKLKYPSE